MDEKPISVSQIGNEIEIRCGDEARRLPLSFLDSMAADIGSGADAMSGRGIVFQGCGVAQRLRRRLTGQFRA